MSVAPHSEVSLPESKSRIEHWIARLDAVTLCQPGQYFLARARHVGRTQPISVSDRRYRADQGHPALRVMGISISWSKRRDAGIPSKLPNASFGNCRMQRAGPALRFNAPLLRLAKKALLTRQAWVRTAFPCETQERLYRSCRRA